MVKIMSFDIPKQVKFWDADNNRYIGGIGYGTEIICGECGGTISIDEIYSDAEDTGFQGTPIIIYNAWVDINEAIIGE